MSVYFDSWADFLMMGGHALYVWLAYGATFGVLLAYWVTLRVRHNRLIKTLRWQMALDQRGGQGPGAGIETGTATKTGQVTDESQT